MTRAEITAALAKHGDLMTEPSREPIDTLVEYIHKGEKRDGLIMYQCYPPSVKVGIQDIETGDYHDIPRNRVKVIGNWSPAPKQAKMHKQPGQFGF